MQNLLQHQYVWIKSSRSVLLDYCDLLDAKDFIRENSSFGRGSIRNLLVHIANTYQYWIGKQALQRDIAFTPYESISTVAETRALFETIDALLADFFQAFPEDHLRTLHLQVNEKPVESSPFQLFTHVATHEFHHKGQVLSLSRHLGYIPVDTDVMR